MKTTTITRADQDVARLDVKLAERLGEPVDPRVRAIAEMDRAALDDDGNHRESTPYSDLLPHGAPLLIWAGQHSAEDLDVKSIYEGLFSEEHGHWKYAWLPSLFPFSQEMLSERPDG